MRLLGLLALGVVACSGATTNDTPDASTNVPSTTPDASTTACTLQANVTASGKTTPSGCAILTRDTTSCRAAREAAGLSGFWLRFSCRVTLTATDSQVTVASDGQPDYQSNYFPTTNACHETYTDAIQNPNQIAVKSYSVPIPRTPSEAGSGQMGGTMGLALNGVPMFSNNAAPGDDIYQEAKTFDRCGAHPNMTGAYHYHSEPYSISYDDSAFVGVLRDGYPVYGRRDPDDSMPALDVYGGHTGVTIDSPDTPVYHYHVNEQTSTKPTSVGEKQWFIMTGKFRGATLPCASCGQ